MLAEGLRMGLHDEPSSGPSGGAPPDGPGAAEDRGPAIEPARPAPHVPALPAPGRTASAETIFAHRPVMLAEVVELFGAPSVPPGVVLDATVGAGGHARALLEAYPELRIVGLDQDPDAVAAATRALAGSPGRATVTKARFDELGEVLDSLGVPSLAGALFDLGVSSPQLDSPARGFSFRAEGPLDMRMDPSQGQTAAELIATSSEAQLARLFSEHGEARFAHRIAAAVVAARPIRTTQALADLVSAAVPAAARRRGHPAKRVFQALRAAVNSELVVLPRAIDAAMRRLAPGGRIVVISYHSGEDRLVKQQFSEAATGGCTCPPGLPCVCGAVPRARLLNRGARMPTAEELAANPRARSARLRAAEALGPEPAPISRKEGR
ncbi:MAG TPA: 16S rRNA (cytosine(1402)-N(4))-methyltransferase RsmH [Acidimicrobiales bacterium]|nr:16S rRNA (cytosine(1402)-N(4))-methyltransferase RsmH [Acidimicrobiales bacterium]